MQNVKGIVIYPVPIMVHARDVEALACHAVNNLHLLRGKGRLACFDLNIGGHIIIRVPVDFTLGNDMLDEGLGLIDIRHMRIFIILEFIHSVIVYANIPEFCLPRHAGDKKENGSFQIRFQSKSQNNEKLQSGQYGTRTRIREWTYVFYQRTALKNKT